jgi:hypothetical protein
LSIFLFLKRRRRWAGGRGFPNSRAENLGNKEPMNFLQGKGGGRRHLSEGG